MPLLALFLIRAAAGYQFQAVAGAAPLLVTAGYDYAQVGLLVGAYMLPGILVTVPAGYLSRTLGDQRVLTAGLFLMMAGTGLMAVDDGFAWLLAVSNLIVSSGAALPKWLNAANLVGSAFDGAVKPFVLWDIVKMAFAAVTVAGVWQIAKKR